jgi:hypothetical protein
MMDKPQAILDKERAYKDARVTLQRPHPHHGKSGTVASVEYVEAIGRWGFVINLDDGDSCFVFEAKHWQIHDA